MNDTLAERMPTTLVPLELPDPSWLRERDRTTGLGAADLIAVVRVRSRLLSCIATALQAADRLDRLGDHTQAHWMRGRTAGMIAAWEDDDLVAGLRCALDAAPLDRDLTEETERLVDALVRQ